MCLFRFSRFESSLRDIDNVLQYWDRSTGTVNRPDTPKSDIQEPEPPSGAAKKGKGDKKDKEKEKEKEKNKEVRNSRFIPSVQQNVHNLEFTYVENICIM